MRNTTGAKNRSKCVMARYLPTDTSQEYDIMRPFQFLVALRVDIKTLAEADLGELKVVTIIAIQCPSGRHWTF